MLTLGFDTSNYTTSVAAFDGVGGKNCSRLLDVKPGELGLRQSDALFAHVKRLPELVDALCTAVEIKNVTAVGVSTRPRAVEGSYMPCFLAGWSQASCLARRKIGTDESTAPCMASVRRNDGIAACQPRRKECKSR